MLYSCESTRTVSMVDLMVMYIPDEVSSHMQKSDSLVGGRLYSHGFDLLDVKQCSMILKPHNY